MKASIISIGFFCLILFVITKLDPVLDAMAKRDYTYGNLYDFSKIEHFKIEIPPLVLDSGWIVNKPEEADIILIGDSFSQVSFGHPRLPQLIGEKFQKKVYPMRYKDIYLEIPDIFKMDLNRKLVIFESTERFIHARFAQIIFYDNFSSNQDFTSSFEKIYGNMFVNADRNYNYFIDHNTFLNRWNVNETFATWRFDLSKITSATTPRFSENPPMLFYHESVTFFYNSPESGEVLDTVAGIENLFAEIEMRGGEALFLSIPEKFTIYHELGGEKRKNKFLKTLHRELDKKGVNNLSIYDTLMNTDQIFYWPTDTHLNIDGYQLILTELAGKL